MRKSVAKEENPSRKNFQKKVVKEEEIKQE